MLQFLNNVQVLRLMNNLSFMPHQTEALDQTDNKNKCAYYLDMGLGKTFVGAEKMYLLNNTEI